MTFQDLIITPIYLLIFYAFAYAIRSKVTDPDTKPYFIPALSVKFLGAIMVGVIYQFYYDGGDTYNYFTHGSRWIWEAFLADPLLGIKLILEKGGQRQNDTFEFSQHIWFYRDVHSYIIVRIAGFFDLFTFHTYSATALFFAAFSFSGSWALYVIFYRHRPDLAKYLAWGIFFLPSVFFWGSGILKDTIVFGAMGWSVFFLHEVFIRNKINVIYIAGLVLTVSLIAAVKVYVLICLLPGMALLFSFGKIKKIKSKAIKVLVAPLLMIVGAAGAGYGVLKFTEDSKRYSFETIEYTAQQTAMWIEFVGETSGGAVYTLGDYDYSPMGMARKFIPAVWVTLFRPYLWEVRNPVMFLSALESALFLMITVYLIVKSGPKLFFKQIFSDPYVLFSLAFAIIFSFAVGIVTYNFGSLVRYKIPALPLYMVALVLIRYSQVQRRVKAK